jgi:hypothetical protein
MCPAWIRVAVITNRTRMTRAVNSDSVLVTPPSPLRCCRIGRCIRRRCALETPPPDCRRASGLGPARATAIHHRRSSGRRTALHITLFPPGRRRFFAAYLVDARRASSTTACRTASENDLGDRAREHRGRAARPLFSRGASPRSGPGSRGRCRTVSSPPIRACGSSSPDPNPFLFRTVADQRAGRADSTSLI